VKSFLIHSVLLLFLAATASADWIIESRTESAQLSYDTTTKVKGWLVRTETTGGALGSTSFIINSASGDTIRLHHGPKFFVRTDSAEVKAAVAAARKQEGANNRPSVALKPTGQSEKVGDYACDIYTGTEGGMTWSFWVARNHPQALALKTLEKRMHEFGLVDPDTSELPGPVIKTQTIQQGGITSHIAGRKKIESREPLITTTTILSIKEQDVDAKEFEVPIGYRAYVAPHQGH